MISDSRTSFGSAGSAQLGITRRSAKSLPIAEQIGFCGTCRHDRTVVEGISGKVELPIMWIDQLSVGSVKIKRVKVIVNKHTDITLLGAAFLNNFIYTIDLESQELRLRARP